MHNCHVPGGVACIDMSLSLLSRDRLAFQGQHYVCVCLLVSHIFVPPCCYFGNDIKQSSWHPPRQYLLSVQSTNRVIASKPCSQVRLGEFLLLNTTMRPSNIRLSNAVSHHCAGSGNDTTSSCGIVRQHDGRSHLSDTYDAPSSSQHATYFACPSCRCRDCAIAVYERDVSNVSS
jgi:hypothetical protein